jgi:hypothetical protein
MPVQRTPTATHEAVRYMAFLDRFRRKREDPELGRRVRLLRGGRIAEGSVIDIGTDASGEVTHIFFSYNVSGVEYESSQYLDQEQRARAEDYAPGARVVIRYDPHQAGNSVVV